MKMEIFSFTRYSMIMSDLWDQISEIADLNKVTHLPFLSLPQGHLERLVLVVTEYRYL